jgi:hypothetical protein
MRQLKLQSFKQAGNYEKERLILKAETDVDLGDYLVCSSIRDDSDSTPGIESEVTALVWLPDKKVEAGDFILIYTCAGDDRSFRNKSGTTSHVIHLDEKQAIWNGGDKAAVLFELARWQFIAVKDDELEEEAEG